MLKLNGKKAYGYVEAMGTNQLFGMTVDDGVYGVAISLLNVALYYL